jgi:hypothetical protein
MDGDDYCCFCRTRKAAHIGKDLRCPTRAGSHFKAEMVITLPLAPLPDVYSRAVYGNKKV